MSALISTFDDAYKSLLQPLAPLAHFGLPLSTLDIVATLRLCVALRQLREMTYRAHLKKGREAEAALEARSFTRNAATALTVVFGGEVSGSRSFDFAVR